MPAKKPAVTEPVVVAPDRVLFWHDSARQMNAWHICKIDAETNPLDATDREVEEADIIKYLGFRPDGGEKQFEVIPAQIRITVPGRSAKNPDQPLLVVDTNVQVNMTAKSFSVLAELSGDFPYGLVKVEGFILNEPVAPTVL